MLINITKDKSTSTLTLHGRFTFAVHGEFREAFNTAVDNGSKVVVVDLHDVEYMDSAALGMLLVIRDRAQGYGMEIVISRPAKYVKSILDIANFQKLFQII